MGAKIPLCSKRKDNPILSNPNSMPNDCPIKDIEVIEAIKVSKKKNNIEEKLKCNCTDEIKDIDSTIQILKIVQYCWADQIPNEGQKIADYDAISQSIKCLEEYKESKEKIERA